MKLISKNISYLRHNKSGYTTMIFSLYIEMWQYMAMLLWWLIWTGCGVGFLYVLLFDEAMKSREKFVLFSIFLFWAYYECRILYVLLWRKFGMEYIKIDEDYLTVKRGIFSYGKHKTYQTQNVEKIEPYTIKSTFTNVMGNSFWKKGTPTLCFKYNDETVYFGYQLTQKEQRDVLSFLRKELKQYQNK